MYSYIYKARTKWICVECFLLCQSRANSLHVCKAKQHVYVQVHTPRILPQYIYEIIMLVDDYKCPYMHHKLLFKNVSYQTIYILTAMQKIILYFEFYFKIH